MYGGLRTGLKFDRVRATRTGWEWVFDRVRLGFDRMPLGWEGISSRFSVEWRSGSTRFFVYLVRYFYGDRWTDLIAEVAGVVSDGASTMLSNRESVCVCACVRVGRVETQRSALAVH